MKNRHFLLFFVFSLFFTSNIFGISFHDITISSDDRLLFKAEFESQHALFISNLGTLSMQQLTVSPDKLFVVDNGRSIIALNRFGAARIPATGGLPSPIPGYPSFSEGNVPLKGRVQDLAASSDGRWILYLEPTSPAFGNLLLVDAATGVKRIVSERVELPAADFPARWSPNSRLFVYAKGGRLFYFPIINDLSVMVDERFRMMGNGSINSISWGQQGDFYYFTGNTLYRILNPELFTRTIYGDFLSIGNVAGFFPLEFDPNFDRFYISPDSSSVLINKNSKGFFGFSLGDNSNNNAFLPNISIPSAAANINVYWPTPGLLTIIFSLNNETSIMRFEMSENHINQLTGNIPVSANGILSPDGRRIIFWKENGLELWDYNNWQLLRMINEPVYSCAWVNTNQFVYANENFIQEISITGSEIAPRRLCLSGIDEFGFEEESRGASRIFARVGSDWFTTDARHSWTLVNHPRIRQTTLASENYRVYLAPQSSGHYKNIPMVRNLKSTGTTSVVSRHKANSAFTLGRPTRVALCFDLYDDDTGLFQVLAALRRHNIKATFFLNGDFIRRSPSAASAIAQAGHETASMFYAPIDFSDARYRITREFIAQGLARNEDEFFNATGKELSLLWHPPFFRSSDFIISAASAAGYETANRTLDPGDWLSRDEANRLNLRQIPPSQMIEQIVQRRTADAVIPIRIGLLPGGREEYLFQRIDVLLDALIRSGCQIVPVSAVNSR